MKRILSLSLFAGLVAVLGGCPIYSDDSSDYRVCDGSQCYDCPNNVYSSACVPWQCGTSLDCPSGYYCGGSGSCVSGSAGQDGGYDNSGDDAGTTSTTCTTPSDCSSGYNCGANGTCDPGDCTTTGCPSGWECVLENGAAVCAQGLSTATDSGSPIASEDGGGTAGDGGLACQQSSECAAPDGGASGSLCLDGTCVAPVNECTDGTQCPSGDKCVQGACTPTCGGSVACPTGYACDQANGVCTGNPAPCESNPSVCTGGTVCSQNHCVAPCGTGSTCPSNEQCRRAGACRTRSHSSRARRTACRVLARPAASACTTAATSRAAPMRAPTPRRVARARTSSISARP